MHSTTLPQLAQIPLESLLRLDSRLHIFMRVLTLELTDTEEEPDEWSFDMWPVEDTHREHFMALRDKYDHTDLQAFDINDKKIKPADYKCLLQGAVVEVHFTFVHYKFTQSSTLVSQLVELRVCDKPRTLPTSPVKRKAAGTSRAPSATGSPTNKQKRSHVYA